MRINNQPARVFFGETLSKRRLDAMGMYAWSSAPENVPRTTQHSSMIPTAENGWSGQNFPGYSNARADALIDAMEVELDQEKSRGMWQELTTGRAALREGGGTYVEEPGVADNRKK